LKHCVMAIQKSLSIISIFRSAGPLGAVAEKGRERRITRFMFFSVNGKSTSGCSGAGNIMEEGT
jgi:hypothetical protein